MDLGYRCSLYACTLYSCEYRCYSSQLCDGLVVRRLDSSWCAREIPGVGLYFID